MEDDQIKKQSTEPSGFRDRDELSDHDLEHVAGGLSLNAIKICRSCESRVAVSGMDICASCFREQNPIP